MRHISQIALATLANHVHAAPINEAVACKSVCGLDELATSRGCEVVTAEAGRCNFVYRDIQQQIVFSQQDPILGLTQVTVEEAINMTQAPDHNCFAMCFENETCRARGSFCTSAGVCANLFWNKQMQNTDNFAFHVEGPLDVSNQASPVTCDADLSDDSVDEATSVGHVDACKAVCYMSSQQNEGCRWVSEQEDHCHRAYWTDSGKGSVDFSARRLPSPAERITVSEVVDVLKVDDCQAVCNSIEGCVSASRGSFCKEDNRTCQGLYYSRSRSTIKAELQVCYEDDCDTRHTPVMCDPAVISSTEPLHQQAPVSSSGNHSDAGESHVPVNVPSTNADARPVEPVANAQSTNVNTRQTTSESARASPVVFTDVTTPNSASTASVSGFALLVASVLMLL